MAAWHSLFGFYPPTHPRLSFLPPGGWILKARGGVGSGSGSSEDYKSDYNGVTIKQNPCVTKPRSSAPPPRLPRAQKLSNPLTSAINARTTLKMPHSTYTKIVCVRLPVATASWRTVIHCYWIIVLFTQYVGLLWNPPTHLSVRHSAIAYTLYYSDGWTQTVTLEYINLPHSSSAYSSWSVHISTCSISETDRYLPLPSIPGAGNTIGLAVADPAVITNFRL